MTMTGDLLHEGAERLRGAGSESPRLDAELLLGFAVGVQRTAVVAHHDAPVGQEAADRYRGFVVRRAAGEPVAYIRGLKEFHALALVVDARALIPRPETEALVDAGVAEVMRRRAGSIRPAGAPPIHVADVGTGSGAVAISLVVALRKLGAAGEVVVLATDISPDALDLARENAVGHAVADHVRFAEVDLLPPVIVDPFDLVLANLPYVRDDAMAGLPVATSFEPALALDGGKDGLEVIERLLERLPESLTWDGVALLEIGADQGESIVVCVAAVLPGWTCTVEVDLAGLPRIARVARVARAVGDPPSSSGRA